MKKLATLALIIISLSSFILLHKQKPTLYLIGDSTVANGSGNNGLWGWGKFLPMFFDSTKINIRNYAVGGTSTRTFQTNGIWDKSLNKIGMWDTVYSKLKKGDYLIIQFGLNDQSPVDDSTRSRGTLHGVGEDSVIILNKVTNEVETVHTFGWYLRKFITQAKEKGATVIVCSSIPKNIWKDGKLIRGEYGFADWALQVAQQENAFSIDLNGRIADVYDKEGEAAVTTKYHIAKDNTHTIQAGSILNASLVVDGIRHLKKCKLRKYLR
jgi:lysophospholipase L1-like esterase